MDILLICLLGRVIRLLFKCIRNWVTQFIERLINIIVAHLIAVEKMLMVLIFIIIIDMRKSLKRDPEKITSKPTGKKI